MLQGLGTCQNLRLWSCTGSLMLLPSYMCVSSRTFTKRLSPQNAMSVRGRASSWREGAPIQGREGDAVAVAREAVGRLDRRGERAEVVLLAIL